MGLGVFTIALITLGESVGSFFYKFKYVFPFASSYYQISTHLNGTTQGWRHEQAASELYDEHFFFLTNSHQSEKN